VGDAGSSSRVIRLPPVVRPDLGRREDALAASVNAVLAAFPAGWLLVFDNAPGQEAVQR
jgi:hypothetical protein